MTTVPLFITIFGSSVGPSSLQGAIRQDQVSHGALATQIALKGSLNQDQFVRGTLVTRIQLSGTMRQDQYSLGSFSPPGAMLSGTMGQDQELTGALISSALQPDPKYTIVPQASGWTGLSFAPVWQPEIRVFTFDVANLVDDDDEIIALIEFNLDPEDPVNAVDPTPAARVLGIAVYNGTLISQRFGNWQALATSITYRLEVLFQTRKDYVISVVSYVDVLPIPTNKPDG